MSCLHIKTPETFSWLRLKHTHTHIFIFGPSLLHQRKPQKENVLLFILIRFLPNQHWNISDKVQLLWTEGPFCSTVDDACSRVIIFQRCTDLGQDRWDIWSYWIRVDCRAFSKPNKSPSQSNRDAPFLPQATTNMHYFVGFIPLWWRGVGLISYMWCQTCIETQSTVITSDMENSIILLFGVAYKF